MQTMTWLGGLCVVVVAAVTACGNGEGTGTTTTGTGGTGGQTTTTTTSASGGAGGGVGGGTNSALVNGCDPSKAEDHTTDGTAMVMFPQGGPKYMPACMTIKVGDSVMFMGDMSAHPLRAGEIVSGMPVPDTKSPILSKNSGMMATFTFTKAGTYGYFSTVDEATMLGAVVVE